MNNIDTVLFDFVGTVMNTNQVILMSWQHTFKTIENRLEDEKKLIQTFGEPLEDTMRKFFPDVPVEEAIEIYRSYHRDNFGELISLFPGMKELFAELRAKGYKLGMVTSRLRQTTSQGLEKYEINEYFDVVVTADDTKKHKPDPEPVYIALKKLGSAPQSSIMLGDTMYDILCAKNAGVKSVLVSWSEALDADGNFGSDAPDYVIHKAEDLLELLGEK